MIPRSDPFLKMPRQILPMTKALLEPWINVCPRRGREAHSRRHSCIIPASDHTAVKVLESAVETQSGGDAQEWGWGPP